MFCQQVHILDLNLIPIYYKHYQFYSKKTQQAKQNVVYF